MILVGHQPEYLPYIGFFQKVARADCFVLVDHVQYAKKDFQNRNYIRSYGGRVQLTVPVLTTGRFDQAINEVEIDPAKVWARKHWNSIHLSYRRAPHFEPYAAELCAAYEEPWHMLSALTARLIRMMLGFLKIDVPVLESSAMDIRATKTEMLSELCKQTGASAYVSGQGARDYVNEDLLRHAGIRHYWCPFEHPVYPQFHGEFIPNLSTLDLLFNCGESAADVLRECIDAAPLEEGS